jgi:hypothetical protein
MRPEHIGKLIEHLEAQPSSRLDERIDALADSQPRVVSMRGGKRTIRSRIAGAALAAVVLLAILIGVPLFNGDGSNVWARALENTRKISNYSYQRTVIERAGDAEAPRVTVKMAETWHISADQGIRTEYHVADERQSASTCYVLYDSSEIVTLYPATKEVHRRRAIEPFTRGTPREMSLRLLEKGNYVELGTKTVDGRVLIGIASRRASDPYLEADGIEDWRQETWFDSETQLPAIVQVLCRTKNTGVSYEIRQDGFQYDVEFPPDFFKPVIPADYTPLGIKGLRLFAELTGGKYPSYLNKSDVDRELGGRTQVEEAIRTKSPPSGRYGYGIIESAVSHFAGAVGHDLDSAYYGSRVTAKDANQVLMYWSDPCQPCEVVWGDLRTETLSKEQLIESCRAAGDRRCLVDLLDKSENARLPLVATCLGDIGDLSSIPALLKHADLRQDSPIAEVLRDAVEAIRRREEQRNPSSAVVAGRLFYANGRSASEGCVHIGAVNVSADRNGYFVMMTPAGDPHVEQVGYAHRFLGANACLFRWTRAGSPAYLTIILDWTCTVGGRVVNHAGEPLAGVNVGLCPYPMEAAGQNWPDGRRAKTDAQGQFLFEDVPVGLPLNLIVERPDKAAGPLRVRIDDLAPDQKRDLGDIAIQASEE